jgi:hypothetical protein
MDILTSLICKRCKEEKSPEDFRVYRNHTTGKVRKLLCHRCNNGLRFIEDTKFMQRALTYLSEQEG